MIKKKIADFTERMRGPDKGRIAAEEKRQKKIRQVEREILNSRLNREYLELGEFVFNAYKKNGALSSHSAKLKKYLSAIRHLLTEKKKLEK